MTSLLPTMQSLSKWHYSCRTNHPYLTLLHYLIDSKEMINLLSSPETRVKGNIVVSIYEQKVT